MIYIEDDIQMLVLRPNSLLHWQPIMIPEKWLDEDTPEIERCLRYINNCKEALWKRWKKKEYF